MRLKPSNAGRRGPDNTDNKDKRSFAELASANPAAKVCRCRISSNRTVETPHPPSLRPSDPLFPMFGPEQPKPPRAGRRWRKGSNG